MVISYTLNLSMYYGKRTLVHPFHFLGTVGIVTSVLLLKRKYRNKCPSPEEIIGETGDRLILIGPNLPGVMLLKK